MAPWHFGLGWCFWLKQVKAAQQSSREVHYFPSTKQQARQTRLCAWIGTFLTDGPLEQWAGRVVLLPNKYAQEMWAFAPTSMERNVVVGDTKRYGCPPKFLCFSKNTFGKNTAGCNLISPPTVSCGRV
jgi:hypothetical protein